MENQNDLLTNELVMDEATSAIAEPQTEMAMEEPTQEPQPQSDISDLDMLINKRTGFFQVNLDIKDLKWIKNSCNNGFNFTGPNEAFMLMNCYMGFSSAISRLETEDASAESAGVQIQAAAVEAAAILINKFEGSSLESAQRIFRVAIALNSPVMEMKELDQIINQLKLAQAKSDEINNLSND
jgi:hypothetical protein